MKLTEVISVEELEQRILTLEPGHGLAVDRGEIREFTLFRGIFRWLPKPVIIKKKRIRRRKVR